MAGIVVGIIAFLAICRYLPQFNQNPSETARNYELKTGNSCGRFTSTRYSHLQGCAPHLPQSYVLNSFGD